MEPEGEGDTSCALDPWNNTQKIEKKMTGRHRNKMAFGVYPDYSIIKNGLNTENSPRDLRRVIVTHTPARNHRLTLVWKISQRSKILIILIRIIIHREMCKKFKFDRTNK